MWGCTRRDVDSVQIISEPPGAMVFIDNKFVGVTPYRAWGLSPIDHALKLQKSGYKTCLGRLNPARTGWRLYVRLESLATGKIVLTSLPTDSRVYVDGRYVGDSPVTVSGLVPGEYQVRVVAEDYEPWLDNVHVKDAAPIPLNAVLSSRYEKYFQGAIAADPNEIFNYTELARHYLVKKDIDAAMEMYKKAMALSNSPNADREATRRLQSELAKAYAGWFADTDEKELEKLRPRILAMFSSHGDLTTFFQQVRAWDNQARGGPFFRPEKPNTETIRYLEATLQKDPKNNEMRLALGQLYMNDRKYDKAQEAYEAALKRDPKNFAVHRQMSDLYKRMGKYEDAQRELEEAAECCADPVWKPELHEKLATVYQARQKQEDAIRQWKKAIEASQDPEDASRRRLRLALLYQKLGQKEDALKLYKTIVESTTNPGLRNYAQYFLKRAQR
jgi:tetratricopeptide (TPR) repeat protein